MLRRAHLQNATSFLASRAVNATLVLAQLALVGHLYGTDETSKFFVFWTVVLAGSVGIRFGFDFLLPKHAAAASHSGSVDDLRGYRRVATYSIPIVALLTAPLLLIVLPDADVGMALAAAPFALAGAVGWAVVYLASALARGYGHAGLSGWIGGPIGIALATCAVPVAHAFSDSWFVLGMASSLALLLSGLAAVLLVNRAVGWTRVREALFRRPEGPADPDTWSTGGLTAVGEVNLVLPVWIAGALGLSAEDVAGLYAAIRVAAAFSWLFTSVVAVVTPLIAEALTKREYERLRRLLWRSAVVGAGTTAPVALLGVVFAAQILGVLDPSYDDYGDLLIALVGGRLADAAAGAVGEALILGDHARWELVNQILSTVVLLVLALALEPSLGVFALALGAGVSVVFANLARVLEVRWLFSNTWQPRATAEAIA